MSILSKKLTDFDEEDVKLLDEMLSKFAAYKRSGLPDYSANYVAYFPVLTLALLKAQKGITRLTWTLIGLTVILAILTGFSIAGI